MTERILVTGGTGLVGKALQDVVNSTYTYKFLSRLDGDLTNPVIVDTIFRSFLPTIVVHLSANVGGLFKNINEKVKMYEDNLLMNTYILQACVRYNVSKVICMLSTCIFPDGVEPLTTDTLHLGPPHPSNEGYAYAKRMLDIHTKLIHESTFMTCINIVPTNIYGPYDNFDLKNGHVLPSLIHRCYLAKKDNTPFVVYGSGKPLRQFVYNKDLAHIIHSYICNDIKGHHLVMCSPPSSHEISIRTLAETIKECVGYTGEIQWTQHADGQYKKTVEPTIEYKWTPIEQGIQETVKWFNEMYPNIRK